MKKTPIWLVNIHKNKPWLTPQEWPHIVWFSDGFFNGSVPPMFGGCPCCLRAACGHGTGGFLGGWGRWTHGTGTSCGFHGDLMGFNGDLMGFNGDFIVILWDLMGFHGDLMRFNGIEL